MDTTLTQAPASGPAWRGVLRPLITAGGYRAASPAAGSRADRPDLGQPVLEPERRLARIRLGGRHIRLVGLLHPEQLGQLA